MATNIEIKRSLLSPPGDTIQETIDFMGMSQAELAERMGRPKEKVNDIIKGRDPISTATAFQLEKVLGIQASFWLTREKDFRQKIHEISLEEYHEECNDWVKNFPLNPMRKLGFLPDSKIKHELVENVLKFFGVASPDEWQKIYIDEEVSVAFRVSLANTNNPYAISAWLRMGEIQSKNIETVKFDKKGFKNLIPEIKELAFEMPDNFHMTLQELCASCGVKLIYTPRLPKAPISGATRWFRNTPIIQLSDRFKTDDHFWFTFFHEAGHILLHRKKDIFLEGLEGTIFDEDKEDEANKFASNVLISRIELKEIVSSMPYSVKSIKGFSEAFRIPTSVIVGRLQHMKLIPFSGFNQLKNKVALFS